MAPPIVAGFFLYENCAIFVGAMENELSRKERRDMHRQEQLAERNSGRRKRLFRRLALWGVGLAVIGGIGWGMVRLASNVTLPTTTGTLAVPVSTADHRLGPEQAPITIVEYSDFQCPACASFYPLVKQILADPAAKDRIRFVYRNFPLTTIHANAQLAAQSAEAAALQGKFWEMHDKLFEGQKKWSGMSSAGARDQFTVYARELKLDIDRFGRDIDSTEVKNKIKSDVDSGLASRVNSTPTFFINNTQMPAPQNYEQLKSYFINGIQ